MTGPDIRHVKSLVFSAPRKVENEKKPALGKTLPTSEAIEITKPSIVHLPNYVLGKD